jgi:hypothetical protein
MALLIRQTLVINEDDAVDRHPSVNAAKGISSVRSLEPFSWRTNIRG